MVDDLIVDAVRGSLGPESYESSYAAGVALDAKEVVALSRRCLNELVASLDD